MSVVAIAREANVSAWVVRGWIKRGCPVVRRGKRGRGHRTLLDAAAVRAWLDVRGAAERKRQNDEDHAVRRRLDRVMSKLADELPDLIANAALEAYGDIDDGQRWKHDAARPLALAAALACVNVLNRLRCESDDVPFEIPEPENLRRLTAIYLRSRTLLSQRN